MISLFRDQHGPKDAAISLVSTACPPRRGEQTPNNHGRETKMWWELRRQGKAWQKHPNRAWIKQLLITLSIHITPLVSSISPRALALLLKKKKKTPVEKANKGPLALKASPHLWNFHPYFSTFVTSLPPPSRCLFPVCFSSSAFRCQGQQRRTGPPASWCGGRRTVKREGSGEVGWRWGWGGRCGGSWSLTLARSGASVEVDPRGWRTALGVASHLLVFCAPQFMHTHVHTHR